MASADATDGDQSDARAACPRASTRVQRREHLVAGGVHPGGDQRSAGEPSLRRGPRARARRAPRCRRPGGRARTRGPGWWRCRSASPVNAPGPRRPPRRASRPPATSRPSSRMRAISPGRRSPCGATSRRRRARRRARPSRRPRPGCPAWVVVSSARMVTSRPVVDRGSGKVNETRHAGSRAWSPALGAASQSARRLGQRRPRLLYFRTRLPCCALPARSASGLAQAR